MKNNKKGKTLWVFESLLDFPYEKVRSRFFNIKIGEFSKSSAPLIFSEVGVFSYSPKIIVKGGPEDFNINSQGQYVEYKMKAATGEDSSSLTLEGQWWYRGVYSISRKEEHKTLLKQEVFNISPGISRLAFPIIKMQGTRAKLESAFQNLARSFETQLATDR
jgi:hypothetical protein